MKRGCAEPAGRRINWHPTAWRRANWRPAIAPEGARENTPRRSPHLTNCAKYPLPELRSQIRSTQTKVSLEHALRLVPGDAGDFGVPQVRALIDPAGCFVPDVVKRKILNP